VLAHEPPDVTPEPAFTLGCPNGTYDLLDCVPGGRDEVDLPWPMAWVRHHDRYGG